MSTLDSNECYAVVHGLQIAAERFDDNAATLRAVVVAKAEPGDDPHPYITADAARLLAENFDDQARRTRHLARRFHRSSEVTLSEDESDDEGPDCAG